MSAPPPYGKFLNSAIAKLCIAFPQSMVLPQLNTSSLLNTSRLVSFLIQQPCMHCFFSSVYGGPPQGYPPAPPRQQQQSQNNYVVINPQPSSGQSSHSNNNKIKNSYNTTCVVM